MFYPDIPTENCCREYNPHLWEKFIQSFKLVTGQFPSNFWPESEVVQWLDLHGFVITLIQSGCEVV